MLANRQGLVRRNVGGTGDKEEEDLDHDIFNDENLEDKYSKGAHLTLMEEILLLGINDQEGYLSFFNDNISPGLRGCILVELALRSRIQLEQTGLRRRALAVRRVELISEKPTGDVLLDETLKHMRELADQGCHESVEYWIELLSGETWNPMKLKYQLRNVRERLLKSLAEKGVLSTERSNFLLFDMTTHPVAEMSVKEKVVSKLQQSLLSKWQNDLGRFDKRALALIFLAHSSEVLDTAFKSLGDDDYELAMKRLREVLDTNPESEGQKANSNAVLWAVVDAFNNR